MKMPHYKLLILNGILLSVLLFHSVYRDIRMNQIFPEDLRNRVVGARLQKDGKLPYTYHWQPADGMRYYDAVNLSFNPSGINNITASPFFHELLYPVCDWPQLSISRFWLVTQYMFLAAMVLMLSSLTTDRRKKWLLLNAAVLFTLTEAWKTLIGCGQLYLFTGFMICCVIAGLLRNKKSSVVFASICAAAFVLTRPVALVLFIPFLINYKRNLLFLSVSFTAIALYGLFILINPFEKALYKNYAESVQITMQNHYNAYLGLFVNENYILKDPSYQDLEGFNMAEVKKYRSEHPKPFYSENGNALIVYEKITGRKLPVGVLNIFSAGIILLLSILFYLRFRHQKASTAEVVLFGCTLCLIGEIFLPVFRHQYNTVQWFPLVMTGILILSSWKNLSAILFTAGLLLNICNFQWIPMRHTLGEICWLAACLVLVFTFQPKESLTVGR